MPDTPLSSWWSHVQESLLDTTIQGEEGKARQQAETPFTLIHTQVSCSYPSPKHYLQHSYKQGSKYLQNMEQTSGWAKTTFWNLTAPSTPKDFSIFPKNPASFLHFCNRSQSHSWSLVSSRGHFNEALLPWRKKVLHWSSDRMWSNLCTELWNALHFAVAPSFVQFCCKSIYSYLHFVCLYTHVQCTYCALKEELHESICVEGGE